MHINLLFIVKLKRSFCPVYLYSIIMSQLLLPSKNKRLSILSEKDRHILYNMPDFTEEQRYLYFSFTEAEEVLIQTFPIISQQLFCALQIGYFKAKQLFFFCSWEDIPKEHVHFMMRSYFQTSVFHPVPITRMIYYKQCSLIKALFGYHYWSARFMPTLQTHLRNTLRTDATLPYIITEAICWFNECKIIRPKHTTLQDIISFALNAERKRLAKIIKRHLLPEERKQFKLLLATENVLSDLAALKQDAKDFKYHLIRHECKKLSTLQPFYRMAQKILPKLEISQENIRHYAALAHFYTVYELRQFKPEQSCLYLLCYSGLRYQQLVDNLIEAFCYNSRKCDTMIKDCVKEEQQRLQSAQEQYSRAIGQLLQLFPDSRFSDQTPYKYVREEAFSILSEEAILLLSEQFMQKQSLLDLYWHYVDEHWKVFRKYLRPLFTQLEFSSIYTDHPWLHVVQLLQRHLNQHQTIPEEEASCTALIPKKLKPYLTQPDGTLQTDRYEYWLYRQCRKRLTSGELCVDDSTKHKNLDNELTPHEEVKNILPYLSFPILKQPIDQHVSALCQELHHLWSLFDTKLKQNTLQDIEWHPVSKKITVKKRRTQSHQKLQDQFYEQLIPHDITHTLGFINSICHFTQAFTPLQPHYSKHTLNEGELFACLMAQAMNYGLYKMRNISDIGYHTLYTTKNQYIRLATLKAANDRVSNTIASLDIFPQYAFAENQYAAVDGQKYETKKPTLKARHSKKYFGKGRGVVAYTLLCNHIPLQSYVISPHEHESLYVFDIISKNTTIVIPETVSGDMHSINKVNFAILDWFNCIFSPRFTNLDAEIKRSYSGYEMAHYDNYLIKPAGQIKTHSITEEWPELRRIMVSLAQKNVSQSVIVRKLCHYTSNRVRKALFEYDKLIRSIYTLNYLLKPEIKHHVHHSQNRIEQYHQLRAVIANVGGKKELTGKTDIDIEISNECGRLIANIIICYNSILLSHLFKKYQAEDNQIGLNILKKISPIGWQHVHFLGQYSFNNASSDIDLDDVVSKLDIHNT